MVSSQIQSPFLLYSEASLHTSCFGHQCVREWPLFHPLRFSGFHYPLTFCRHLKSIPFCSNLWFILLMSPSNCPPNSHFHQLTFFSLFSHTCTTSFAASFKLRLPSTLSGSQHQHQHQRHHHQHYHNHYYYPSITGITNINAACLLTIITGICMPYYLYTRLPLSSVSWA